MHKLLLALALLEPALAGAQGISQENPCSQFEVKVGQFKTRFDKKNDEQKLTEGDLKSINGQIEDINKEIATAKSALALQEEGYQAVKSQYDLCEVNRQNDQASIDTLKSAIDVRALKIKGLESESMSFAQSAKKGVKGAQKKFEAKKSEIAAERKSNNTARRELEAKTTPTSSLRVNEKCVETKKGELDSLQSDLELAQNTFSAVNDRASVNLSVLSGRLTKTQTKLMSDITATTETQQDFGWASEALSYCAFHFGVNVWRNGCEQEIVWDYESSPHKELIEWALREARSFSHCEGN